MSQITKIAIVGNELVTNETEALEAARFALDWNGSSEGDSRAECEVVEIPDEEEDGPSRYEVVECWGAKANRNDDGGDVLATFATEAEAEAFAAAHNAAALARWAQCDWIELPRPLDFVQFAGCRRGDYPQSRHATIRAEVGGEEIEVTGSGNAPFVRDSHSHSALRSAVAALVEELAKPATVA